MSRSSLERAIPAGDRILIDASVLVAYLNTDEAVTPLAQVVIDEFIELGRNVAVASTVTAMELLIQPIRRGPEQYEHVYNFLTEFPNLAFLDIDMPVALQAANVRAFAGFAPADALVIATGFIAQVGHLVTNDARWLRLNGFPHQRIRVCLLQDHAPL